MKVEISLRDSINVLQKGGVLLVLVPSILLMLMLPPYSFFWGRFILFGILLIIAHIESKHWFFIIKNYTNVRNRYLVVSFVVFTTVYGFRYYGEFLSFNIVFTFFIFGGIGFLILIFWFSRAFSIVVLKGYHRFRVSEFKKEQEYFSSFSNK